MQKIGTVFATVWGTSLAREHSCGCWANGEENEPLCEESGFAIGQCLTQGGKCHWGPGEVPECAKEASDFEKTQGVQTTQMNDMMFMQHMSTHGLSFGTIEEFNFRKSLFAETEATLQKLRADPTMTSTVGHNKLSTMTEAEKKAQYGLVKSTLPTQEKVLNTESLRYSNGGVDWTSQMQPVQNQGNCGSCWAFSATAVIEHAHRRATGQSVKLSEQQMVSCDRATGNAGCNGGDMYSAMVYTKSKGLATAADYPYVQVNSSKNTQCDLLREGGAVKAQVVTRVPSYSPDQLKAAIQRGVVSVGVAAGSSVFGHYTGGVISGSGCNGPLNHGINAVGFGSDANGEYYIVRNSWGAGWGQGGYGKIAVAQGAGTCQIQTYSNYSTAN